MGQTLTNGVYLPDNGERNCYTGLSQNWQKLDNLIGSHGDSVSFSQTLTEGVEIGKITINGTEISMYHTDYSSKADASNVYTKTEIDTSLSSKADASDLTTHTSNADIHVTSTDKYTWNGKQGALSTAQLNACNSGITSTKVSSYDTHVANSDVHVTTSDKSTWNAKQDSLTDTQLSACNSGITSDKVATYDGYATSKANDSDVVHTSGDETINGAKTFSETSPLKIQGSIRGNEFSTNARTVLELRSNRDTTNKSAMYFSRLRNNKSQGSLTSSEYHILTVDALENGVRTNRCLEIALTGWENDVPKNIELKPNNSSCVGALGNANSKWKKINGINPGALSLPNYGVSAEQASIVGHITEINKSNYYTPSTDGYVCVTNNSSKTVRLRIGSGQLYSDQTNIWHSVYIPVRKDVTVDIYVYSDDEGFSTADLKAYFYPCQGNV